MLKRTTTQPVVFWALVVDTCAPGIRFRVSGPGEGNRVTSSFGRLVGAQMAINGDFADQDFGLNVGNGQTWPYPDTTHSGNFSVGPNRVEMTPDYVQLAGKAPWVTEQLGGRWTLLNAGVPQYGIDDNGPASGGFVCAPGLRHPRTAIGLSQDKRKAIIIVADGRTSASIGMTCDELINVFIELGAHDAMGLDGGGSSTLWKYDQVLNHPTDPSGERVVRNHLALFASGTGPAPHCGAQLTPPEPAQSDPVPGSVPPAVVALTPHSRFTPITPSRLFDTRTAVGSTRLIRGDASNEGPLSLSSSGTFGDWGSAGVPATATAVWLNVAAVGLQVPGFLTVFPSGRPRPTASNINYSPGQTVSNAVPSALGLARQLSFEVHAAVDVIADLAGAFAPTGAGFEPIPPTRVLDTRSPSVPLQAGVPRMVDVRAPAGSVAVAANVTVIAGPTAGFLTASPCGAPVPTTSNLNFGPSDAVANLVVSQLSGSMLCLTSSAAVDVVVDVMGYFTPSAALSYVALVPQRLLDTRGNATPFTGRLAAGQVVQVPIQSLPGMPANVGAVVANVTVTSASAAGYLSAFPCGVAPPVASTVNFPADGGVVGGLAMTAVGQGAVCLVSAVRAHVIVDLMGVWAVPPPDAGVTSSTDAGVEIALDAGEAAADAGVVPPGAGVGAADAGNPATKPNPPEAPVTGSCGCTASAGLGPLAWVLLAVASRFGSGRRRAQHAAVLPRA